jgi:hypothetical protein
VAKEKVPMKPHSTHSTFETMKVYGVLVELFQYHSLAFTVGCFRGHLRSSRLHAV